MSRWRGPKGRWGERVPWVVMVLWGLLLVLAGVLSVISALKGYW